MYHLEIKGINDKTANGNIELPTCMYEYKNVCGAPKNIELPWKTNNQPVVDSIPYDPMELKLLIRKLLESHRLVDNIAAKHSVTFPAITNILIEKLPNNEMNNSKLSFDSLSIITTFKSFPYSLLFLVKELPIEVSVNLHSTLQNHNAEYAMGLKIQQYFVQQQKINNSSDKLKKINLIIEHDNDNNINCVTNVNTNCHPLIGEFMLICLLYGKVDGSKDVLMDLFLPYRFGLQTDFVELKNKLKNVMDSADKCMKLNALSQMIHIEGDVNALNNQLLVEGINVNDDIKALFI